METSEATEEALLIRVARGEAGAVDACLQRYAPLVWSLAKKLSRDVASLEDVVQEIFIEVWKSAGRFDPSRASEATFIGTIARRRIIDRQRRIVRSVEMEDIDEKVVPEETTRPSLELGDEAALARQALGKLAPDQRRVILMSVVEGLTHQEIAASTGIPLGTVKSHIRRGLEKTAERLRMERGADA